MFLTLKLNQLVDKIAATNELTAAQKASFKNLADAWETSLATSAAIEPDDDFQENDKKLLPVLDAQEDEYNTLLEQASAEVKKAFDAYLKSRPANLD